jgi:hypothetical protein
MNTDELVAHSRARFDHAVARRTLKEKYQTKLIFAHAGGMWRASPELLSMLNCCVMDKDVVILDMYENPVKVDTKELWNLATKRWQEQMNAWLVEHEELNKNR